MNLKDIKIKESQPGDLQTVMQVETEAFGYDKEAKLTADLLNDETAKPLLSLLAYYENEPIGHILFTRVYLEDKNPQPLLHILAPLAIKPKYQKKGIGGLLITEGLKKLKEMGSEMVFVLGHMEYYPRYGFTPDAGKLGFAAPFPIPEEVADAWMVQSLKPEGFMKKTGKIICADELNREEHWRE